MLPSSIQNKRAASTSPPRRRMPIGPLGGWNNHATSDADVAQPSSTAAASDPTPNLATDRVSTLRDNVENIKKVMDDATTPDADLAAATTSFKSALLEMASAFEGDPSEAVNAEAEDSEFDPDDQVPFMVGDSDAMVWRKARAWGSTAKGKKELAVSYFVLLVKADFAGIANAHWDKQKLLYPQKLMKEFNVSRERDLNGFVGMPTKAELKDPIHFPREKFEGCSLASIGCPNKPILKVVAQAFGLRQRGMSNCGGHQSSKKTLQEESVEPRVTLFFMRDVFRGYEDEGQRIV